MNTIVALTILAPLVGAAIGLLVRTKPLARDLSVFPGLVVAALASIALLVSVEADGTHVSRVGGWAPELGIVLVADLFAVLVLPVALLLAWSAISSSRSVASGRRLSTRSSTRSLSSAGSASRGARSRSTSPARSCSGLSSPSRWIAPSWPRQSACR